MKKITKLLSIITIISILLTANIVYAQQSTLSDEQCIKSVVEAYLDSYFKSFITLRQEDTNNIVEENNDTLLYKKMHEWQLAANKMFDTGYKNYELSIDYKNLSIRNSVANIDILLHVDYQYKNAGDIESGLYNIPYTFILQQKGDSWIITKIDSSFDEFEYFKADVDKKIKAHMSKKKAIDEVANEKIRNISLLAEQMKTSSINRQEVESENVIIQSGSYSYSASNGASYATRFAEAPISNRFFYTVSGGDCTNFVSQCVWAGYGGYVSTNDTTTKNNIANKVRMVPNVWHGGTGGGMTNWENVTSFWNYAISSKSVGPKGTGSNNNGKATNLTYGTIVKGNALQVRYGSSGSYGHSVYVSSVLLGPPEYGDPCGFKLIYVCQHTSDKKNRMLLDLVNAWGGSSNCYMRKISFSTANFNS